MFKQQTKKEGFTIIEVLIVLAIAGLIMLVVFLAVPNLQRSQRNNAYRNEAVSLIGAFNEISGNNNGAVLTSADEAAVTGAANLRNITTVRIGPYSATAITVGATTTGVDQVSLTKAVFRTGSRCAGAASGTATAGSTRQAALYYVVETSGGGTQIQCQEA